MKISSLVVTLSLAVALLAAKPAALNGGGKKPGNVPLVSNVYDAVVDEHDTNAYYGSATFCPGSSAPFQTSNFAGDFAVTGPMTAYEFGSPWALATGLSSTGYADGSDCGQNCLRVQFNSGLKILSFDTRGTLGPRKMSLNFSEPCGQAEGCPGPGGDPAVFGGSLSTPGLLNVFLDFPFTDMEVCTSTACPEAQPAFAKFWFTDPADSQVTWRVDWYYLRVLRMSADAWYVIADACDGTQIAGFSKLEGNRGRPKTVFNGYYKIPFFLGLVKP